MSVAATALSYRRRQRSRVMPGFVPSFAISTIYLGVLVLVPLAALVLQGTTVGPARVLTLVTDARVLSAFRISFGLALAAAVLNGAVGLLVAWVLVRYRFPGRRFLDALVDLPFALPTAVAGIALATLYSDTGWIGSWLAPWDIAIAYTPLGIFVALAFVGLPYVIRTVQPVLADLEREVEEAALTLGAGRGQIFRRVILPPLVPAVLTGVALAFARGVGEYGSVIFIAGNMPGRSEILPLLIVARLEQFDYGGAAVLATAMLLASFLLLLAINFLQGWSRRRHGG